MPNARSPSALDAALAAGATRAWSPRSTGRARARCARGRAVRSPASRSSSQRAAVRRSCQTIARWRGRPVVAVPDDGRLALVGDADRRRPSRPSRCGRARRPRRASRASRPRSRRRRARPSPGCGKCCGNSRYARRRGRPVLVDGDRADAGGAGVDREDDAPRAQAGRRPGRCRARPRSGGRARGRGAGTPARACRAVGRRDEQLEERDPGAAPARACRTPRGRARATYRRHRRRGAAAVAGARPPGRRSRAVREDERRTGRRREHEERIPGRGGIAAQHRPLADERLAGCTPSGVRRVHGPVADSPRPIDSCAGSTSGFTRLVTEPRLGGFERGGRACGSGC